MMAVSTRKYLLCFVAVPQEIYNGLHEPVTRMTDQMNNKVFIMRINGSDDHLVVITERRETAYYSCNIPSGNDSPARVFLFDTG